jgi:hypothetical protein
VGDDLFVDFLHPNLRGNQLIGAAIADTLRTAGIPVPAAQWKTVEPDPPPERLHAENPRLHEQERASRMVTCVLAQWHACMREEATALARSEEYGAVARGVLQGLAARAPSP